MGTAQARWLILEKAKSSGNVKATCSACGISRTLFYRWKRRFEEQGIKGLEDQAPRRPAMPNQVPEAIEKAILSQVAKMPKDGPRQISYMLGHQGYRVGETGVYRVMKRHGLSRRSERLVYARSQETKKSDGRQMARLDLKLKKKAHQVPGYLIMETLRPWQPPGSALKQSGAEPYYFYALCDVHSRWGMIKLFPHRSSIKMADFYARSLLPLSKTFQLPIQNVLSEEQGAFEEVWAKCWPAGKTSLRQQGEIKHFKLPPEMAKVLQPLNDFINSIFSAIEAEAPTGKRAFGEWVTLLEARLRAYNFKEAQAGGIPAEVVLSYIASQGIDPETLPLWVHLRRL